MTSSIVDARGGITGAGSPVVSIAPIELAAPGRPVPLEVRASAPATGTDLPVVVFSHGNGWNLDGYAPLTAFWASRGFVVIQPTHLDSRGNGIGFDHPVFPRIWTQRIADLSPTSSTSSTPSRLPSPAKSAGAGPHSCVDA